MDDDHLGIVMDAANLFTLKNIGDMDKVMDEAFRLLGKDVILAHGKDFYLKDGQIGYCGSGRGMVDFHRFKALLQESGYDGPIIMHGLSREDVRDCVNYLEKI